MTGSGSNVGLVGTVVGLVGTGRFSDRFRLFFVAGAFSGAEGRSGGASLAIGKTSSTWGGFSQENSTLLAHVSNCSASPSITKRTKVSRLLRAALGACRVWKLVSPLGVSQTSRSRSKPKRRRVISGPGSGKSLDF